MKTGFVATTGILLALLFLFCGSLRLVGQGPEQNIIRVQITGLRSDKGQVLCALFSSSSAADFPKKADKAMARTQSAISQGQATCTFSGVVPGTYAVSVFHDENSNGKMDTNFMGIPREGVGASNNAVGHFGPPKFDAAAFRYSSGEMNLSIKINYL